MSGESDLIAAARRLGLNLNFGEEPMNGGAFIPSCNEDRICCIKIEPGSGVSTRIYPIIGWERHRYGYRAITPDGAACDLNPAEPGAFVANAILRNGRIYFEGIVFDDPERLIALGTERLSAGAR
jgi:hypothetical protein